MIISKICSWLERSPVWTSPLPRALSLLRLRSASQHFPGVVLAPWPRNPVYGMSTSPVHALWSSSSECRSGFRRGGEENLSPDGRALPCGPCTFPAPEGTSSYFLLSSDDLTLFSERCSLLQPPALFRPPHNLHNRPPLVPAKSRFQITSAS